MFEIYNNWYTPNGKLRGILCLGKIVTFTENLQRSGTTSTCIRVLDSAEFTNSVVSSEENFLSSICALPLNFYL